MKKKTVWSLLLALAMTVTAIGASTAAFAAAPNQAEPQTLIATENEDAIWDQIEALEEKSDAVFQRNEALWDKVDEACNALPDDYDFAPGRPAGRCGWAQRPPWAAAGGGAAADNRGGGCGAAFRRWIPCFCSEPVPWSGSVPLPVPFVPPKNQSQNAGSLVLRAACPHKEAGKLCRLHQTIV